MAARCCEGILGTPLLRQAAIDPKDRDALALATRVRVYEAGQTIYNQDDQCAGVYCVESGLTGVRRLDEHGNSAMLGLGQTGDIFGYRALLTGNAHLNTVEALTSCRICFTEASSLRRIMARNPALKEAVHQLALDNLSRVEAKCAVLLTRGLKLRLLALLDVLKERFAKHIDEHSYVIDLPILRKDLAGLLGAEPASLSRLIREVSAEGIIFDGQRILIRSTSPDARLRSRRSVASAQSLTARILDALLEARSALLAMIDEDDANARSALHGRVCEASARLDDLLRDSVSARDDLATGFMPVWEQFKNTRNARIIPAVYAGRRESARKLATGIQARRLAQMKKFVEPRLACAQAPGREYAPCL